MSTIKVNIDPVFNKLLMKLKNRAPVMKIISGIMLDEVHQNFVSGGRPVWRALAESTKKDRKSKGYSLDPKFILQRTGQLLKSIHARYDNDSALVGTNKKYAGLHQFGGTINQGGRSSLYKQARFSRGDKKGKFKKVSKSNREYGQGFTFKARTFTVPPRPFLTISDKGIKNIQQAIVDYLKK